MKYWKQGFYETPIEGAIEITNERFEELIDGQNAGKMSGSHFPAFKS